jgi:uncharacterized protein (DUF2267 family)
MATDRLSVVDSAVEDFYRWINEVRDELGGADRHDALHALRAVLHALRDRLLPDQMAHLAAQLPLMVRGVFFENWHPSQTPVRERTVEGFVGLVLEELEAARAIGEDQDVDGEEIVRAVMTVLTRHISPGETEKLKHVLPKHFRVFFESGASA